MSAELEAAQALDHTYFQYVIPKLRVPWMEAFGRECKRFEIGCLEDARPLRNVSAPNQAICDRLGSAASASVDRLFDKSTRRLFTDLLQIGRHQGFEPITWAHDQTLHMVRRALNQIPEIFPSSHYKKFFLFCGKWDVSREGSWRAHAPRP